MPDAFDSWAIVELMGHVKMAGRVTEEERFGAKMGRVDVPTLVCCPVCGGSGNVPARPNDNDIERDTCVACDGKERVDGFASVYFTGSSIYRLSPCSEEVARHVAKRNQPEPVHQWELPKQLEAAATLPRRTPKPTDYDPDDYPDDDDDDDSREMEL